MCVCVCVSLQVQFVDYGSERIVDLSHLYVLMPQFCRLNRQGIRCQLAVADETGSAVEMTASAVSRPSLEAVLLNKLIVIKVMSMSDEDTCCVLLPQCDHNQLQIPQLARSDILSSYIMAVFIYSVGSVQLFQLWCQTIHQLPPTDTFSNKILLTIQSTGLCSKCTVTSWTNFTYTFTYLYYWGKFCHTHPGNWLEY